MATFKGTDGVVSNAGTNFGELVDFTLNITAQFATDTAAGDSWVTRKLVRKDFTATINCHYDPSDTSQAAAVEGASAAYVFYPEGGEGSGLEQFTGNALVSGVSTSTPLDGIVPYTISLVNEDNTGLVRGVDS